jgi:hypothetical protein
MTPVRTALAAALVALLALAAPAPAGAASVPRGFFGVMADGPLLAPGAGLAGEARLMRRAGVGSARVAFYWREMQPQPGGPVDFAGTDRIVGALSAAGVGVLPVLVRAPAWAAGGDEREGAVPDAAGYGAFAAEVVRRYGPRGTFWAGRTARPLRRWQIWNEPDIPRYLAPPAGTTWPAAYVPLLRAARTAIRGVDPGARIVAAGLTNRSWEELGRLYRAGARRLFDEAAIHPFSRRVANVVKIVRLARAEMRRRGDARKPLLLTEVSWSSGQGRSTLNYGWETTERGQAGRLRDAFAAFARERTRLRIGGVWWYTWLSPPVGDDESFSYGGLRRLHGGRIVAKPALDAFRSSVRRLERRR